MNVRNDGVDTAVKSTLIINLAGTYVAGTIQYRILSLYCQLIPTQVTDNAGFKTDAGGDDQAEVSALFISARIGTGATATVGGSIAVNSYSAMSFQFDFQAGVYIRVRMVVTAIGNTQQSMGVTTPSSWPYDLYVNTLCANPSLFCDQEGAINATCDGSSGTAVCSCPGNYVQVNKTCQCKRNIKSNNNRAKGINVMSFLVEQWELNALTLILLKMIL